jgi:hypothetical protein
MGNSILCMMKCEIIFRPPWAPGRRPSTKAKSYFKHSSSTEHVKGATSQDDDHKRVDIKYQSEPPGLNGCICHENHEL